MSKTEEIFLKDYKEPEFRIESVSLVFDLYEEKTIVKNKMVIEKRDADVEDLLLDTQDLELVCISLDGVMLEEGRYHLEEEHLRVIKVPHKCEVEITNIIYPHKNTELEGLYKSGDIFCTQCEPEGFRRITPYIDRPDVMSVFTTTIKADKTRYPLLLSNGNKHQCHEAFDGRHAVTWHDPHPKPSYLFALVAGDLGCITDTFCTMNNKEVELNIYVDKGNESQAYHAMNSLKNAMVWDEEKYGREYDLDIYNIVAVESFNMGAMENKGLNIFNSAYVLADVTTASDANFMGVESVIAHEYFHNWTGNRITCREWFELTLKEGLTVFRDQCFSAEMNSPAVQRIEDVKALRERQFVEDSSPTRHPIQPKSYISMNNFYTATVYEKGAEVIRMLHTFLGEQNYFKAMDLYFERFDGQAVRIEEFLWAMEQYGEFDLQAFRRWYDQSGTPRLHVDEVFENGVYQLTLTQEIPPALDGTPQLPHYYPLKIALYNEDGSLHQEHLLTISQEKEEFVFEGLQKHPILSINRDFSAPIIVEFAKSNNPFLMQFDTNPFTQYEAAQNFALQTLQHFMKTKTIDPSYIQAYGRLLALDTDIAYKALLLELPSVSSLMQKQKDVDFDAIYEAKEALTRKIATVYEEQLTTLYTQHHKHADNSLESTAMAKRALKNRALKILSILETQKVSALAKEQYWSSANMTDTLAALDVLVHTHNDYAKEALEDFYEKYKTNTLVMNKYFSVLASAQKEDVLQEVERLERNEVYDEKIPNLVRALVGSFTRNYKYFHAKDGSGYRYLSEKIKQIDAINPQMAASLCGAFKIYNKMNPHNKALMQKELECVVSTQSLSKNSFEIIDKILKSQ